MVNESTLYQPIRELARKIRARQLSPVELAEAYLERSERLGPKFNAYVTITRDLAMQQARAAEKEIAAGHYRGPLHGIPYAAKDLVAVKDYPTTWGAKPYADQKFDFNATIVERLNAAGAVLIGKAAMIELAGGLGYETGYASLTGPCRNPWNPEHWTCGSSSGSGAIMAAGLAAFALGSDTRGSIICPSTNCGVSGMRPSFGRVSRYGAMAIAWSMDKLGPMARTADCCGLVLAAIAGHDPKDHDSVLDGAFAYDGATPKLPRGLRIGRLTNVFKKAPAEVNQAVDDALRVMEKAGAKVSDAAVPDGPYEEASELVILIEAASAFHDLIQSGRCAELADAHGQVNGYASLEFSAADYLHIQRVRTFLQERIDKLFDEFDVLVAAGEDRPEGVLKPPQESHVEEEGEEPIESAQPDGISSLCGLPVVVVPCGFSKEEIPLGVQFMGRAMNDEICITAGNLFQAHSDWHTRRPTIAQ